MASINSKEHLDGLIKQDFGNEHDYSLAALDQSHIVGLVWCRQFNKDQESYGYFRDDYLELNISLLPNYRERGIGSRLLKALISILKKRNVEGISLSVTNGNYAQKMYEHLGFKVIEHRNEDTLMVLELKG